MPDTTAPTLSRWHNHTDRQLADELKLVDEANKANKAHATEIQAEIERRYADRLEAVLAGMNKSTGTATIALQDGASAKREVKKEVKYDSDKLLRIMAGMEWEQATALFKLDVSVPEKVYAGLAANPDLKAKIDDARTVTPKPGPIKLVFADADA